eukprot:scaffold1604_cov315-Prasinococcus_capsulatus_cf.AAC.8
MHMDVAASAIGNSCPRGGKFQLIASPLSYKEVRQGNALLLRNPYDDAMIRHTKKIVIVNGRVEYRLGPRSIVEARPTRIARGSIHNLSE